MTAWCRCVFIWVLLGEASASSVDRCSVRPGHPSVRVRKASVSEASQARIARVSGASEAEAARARRYRANVRAEVDMAMIYAALAGTSRTPTWARSAAAWPRPKRGMGRSESSGSTTQVSRCRRVGRAGGRACWRCWPGASGLRSSCRRWRERRRRARAPTTSSRRRVAPACAARSARTRVCRAVSLVRRRASRARRWRGSSGVIGRSAATHCGRRCSGRTTGSSRI
jgi:hypothetical protein